MNTLVLLSLYLFSWTAFSDPIYVTSSSSCTASCAGTITDPINNIFKALEQATTQSSAIIILLHSSTLPHYAILSGSGVTLSSSAPEVQVEFEINDLEIRPLLCTDNAVDSTLQDKCLPPDKKLDIFLKTTNFSIIIKGNLQIKDIIFNGIEDIEKWNDGSSPELSDCLTSQKRCCDTDQDHSTLYPSLTCWKKPYAYSSNPTISMFRFSSIQPVTPPERSLLLENVEFQNFQCPQLKSLIQTSSHPFSLVMNSTVVDKIYFDSGLITHENVSTMGNDSSVVIGNSSFTNYNIWDIQHQNKSHKEGYLFYASGTFSGILKVSNSTFLNITSSTRNKCWAQTKDFYDLPMNNLLTKQPRSRSDLWNQYHNEKFKGADYGSSLIFIKEIYGAIDISDSTFTNILGTSGSVLRIDDVISADNWFTIYNSTFDSNFAYDRFSNIMIAKRSDPSFSSMLDCPRIEIIHSKFLNNYGCPGAYGNVLLLCYWDTEPPNLQSGLKSYTLPADTSNLVAAWVTDSADGAYIKVKNSLFEHNLLSVSNSLAIIGGYFTLLKDNIFQDNGGTTSMIAEISLRGSYFIERYPDGVTMPLELTHFGQSTAVYFDHLMKFHSRRNTYQRNWGAWEGSLALGCSVTVKNWIKMVNGVKFEEDLFLEHTGILTDIVSKLENESTTLANYTEPLVTLSLDISGSDAVASSVPSAFNLEAPMNILFIRTRFENNSGTYMYKQLAYNSNELNTLREDIMSANERYQSGLIKLLWTSEAIDDLAYGFQIDAVTSSRVSYGFKNGTIKSNHLQSMGCLFTGISIIQGTNITENQIYVEKEKFYESESFGDSYSFDYDEKNQGLVCISKLDLAADGIVVKNNRGIIFNLMMYSGSNFSLTNSLFVENNCQGLSMITIRTKSQLFSINNIFIRNNNSAGLTFAYMSGTMVKLFHTNLNNTGRYASISFTDSMYFYEGFTNSYWNDVNPTYKIFTDGLIPQAGLYFLSYTVFTLFNSHFEHNTAYSGMMTSHGSVATLYQCMITNHNIAGTGILGTFLALSSLKLESVSFINNTITKHPELPKSRPAVIVMLTVTLDISDLKIIGGTSSGGEAIFGNVVTGSIRDLTIKDFYRTDKGQSPLVQFSSAMLEIIGSEYSNTTGLFKLTGTSINLTSANILNVITNYESQFLFDMSDTKLNVVGLYYQGTGKYTKLIPLIGGSKNSIKMEDTEFINATGGTNKVFSLKNTEKLVVIKSSFRYIEDFVNVTIFELTSSQNIVIEDCVFDLTGKIVDATDIRKMFYFFYNTILTNSHEKSIALDQLARAHIIDNLFIRKNNQNFTSLPNSQIQILNSENSTDILNNLFSGLYSTNGIIQVKAVTHPYQATFKNNIFTKNTASNGGAIHLNAQTMWTNSNPSSALIENCVFILNNATAWKENEGKGGALYQTTADQTPQATTLIHSLFISNTAASIGGAIFFDYLLPTIGPDSIFIDNYASRPNHIGSYPVQLVHVTSEVDLNSTYLPGTKRPDMLKEIQLYRWNDIGTGVVNEQKYVFALLDMFNQVVYNDNSSILALYSDKFQGTAMSQFTTQLTLKAERGLYTLQDFKFNYNVTEKLNVTFISTGVTKFNPSPVENLVIIPETVVEISFRLCGMGEFFVSIDTLNTCEECPSGFWQLDFPTTALNCEACEEKSTICQGGNRVGPKPGYWRLNEQAGLVLPCPRPASCLGNYVDANSGEYPINPVGACAHGYTGNLCASCLDGWARGSNDECVSCDTNVLSYLLVVVMFLLEGGLIAYGVRATVKLVVANPTETHDKPNKSTLLKIFINYVQSFSLIIGISVSWPEVFKSFLGTMGKLNMANDQLFTVDCFYAQWTKITGIEMVFSKALYIGTKPVIFIVLGTLFWVIYFRLKKIAIRHNPEFTQKIMTTVMIVCYTLQPTVIRRSFSLFECENLYRKEEPIEFMEDAYDIKCWESSHLRWALGFAVPCLILWILILPTLIAYIMRRNRKRLDDIQIARKYSFVYHGYKKQTYFWELVIFSRKILLILNTIFSGSYSTNLEIFLSLTFLLAFYALHVVKRPFSSEELNNLERTSLASLIIINMCGLYFEIVSDAQILDHIMVGVGMTSNLFFLVCFATLFFSVYLERFKQKPFVLKIRAHFYKCWALVFKPPISRSVSRMSPQTSCKEAPEIDSMKLTMESQEGHKSIFSHINLRLFKLKKPRSPPRKAVNQKPNQELPRLPTFTITEESVVSKPVDVGRVRLVSFQEHVSLERSDSFFSSGIIRGELSRHNTGNLLSMLEDKGELVFLPQASSKKVSGEGQELTLGDLSESGSSPSKVNISPEKESSKEESPDLDMTQTGLMVGGADQDDSLCLGYRTFRPEKEDDRENGKEEEKDNEDNDEEVKKEEANEGDSVVEKGNSEK